MRVSVIVNVHGGTDLDQFYAAADSVLTQSYDNMEFLVVAADAPEALTAIEDRYGDGSILRTVTLNEDEGLSTARNAGAEAATGDIVVFTDDDVIAEPDWLSELVAIYETHDPVGVGGRVIPIWPEGKPRYLPNEFFWLVGAMHDNFVDEHVPQPVRNAFGCNISFDRAAFLEAGGFREDLGKNQDRPLQGEEAELCERIDDEFWYAPDALVRHRVDPGQLSARYLFRRAFWQGYSKAALAEDTSSETSFLGNLLTDSIPRRISHPSPEGLGEVIAILLLTGSVGLGFLYGNTRSMA